MGSAEKDFWYAGKGSNPWRERYPKVVRIAYRPEVNKEEIIEQPEQPTQTERPIIYDRFGRPIEQLPPLDATQASDRLE